MEFITSGRFKVILYGARGYCLVEAAGIIQALPLPLWGRHLSIERVARLKPPTRSVHLYALAKKNPNPFGLRSIFGGGGGNYT
ncbi:hypothetical protein ACMAY9_11295 [Porticoccaceae bacterium nBUS_09]